MIARPHRPAPPHARLRVAAAAVVATLLGACGGSDGPERVGDGVGASPASEAGSGATRGDSPSAAGDGSAAGSSTGEAPAAGTAGAAGPTTTAASPDGFRGPDVAGPSNTQPLTASFTPECVELGGVLDIAVRTKAASDVAGQIVWAQGPQPSGGEQTRSSGHADRRGRWTWTLTVPETTTPGRATLLVSARAGDTAASGSFHFTVGAPGGCEGAT